MNRKIKRPYLLILLFLLTIINLSAKEGVQLEVAVRITDPAQPFPELGTDDFILMINGEERAVVDSKRTERCMARVPDLGRNFILSFHMTEYESQVEKGIAYFVSEILHPADSIMLVSPLKIYQVNVSVNKGKIIEDIGQLLKKDCLDYKKKRASGEKYIRDAISKARMALADSTRSAEYGVMQFLSLKHFLDTFPQEFINFLNLSLILDTGKYQKIANLLGFREGERWWLHFHQDEFNVLLSHIQAFTKELSDYIFAREPGETKRLSHLQKVLEIADSFPAGQVLNTLVENRISYNFISFGGLKIGDIDASQAEISDIGRILGKIAEESGGKMVSTFKVEQGLREIASHKDQYYELSFLFNGKIEKKEIDLALKNQKAKLIYKKEYSKEELESLIQYLTQEKVRIDQFSKQGNVIKFTITSFQRHQEGKFGILKVSIELFGKEETPLYQTENTLRSSRDEVSISLPLPTRFSGPFRLIITVSDLLANRRATQERDIKLD